MKHMHASENLHSEEAVHLLAWVCWHQVWLSACTLSKRMLVMHDTFHTLTVSALDLHV